MYILMRVMRDLLGDTMGPHKAVARTDHRGVHQENPRNTYLP
jgi:hypothetical protein